MASTRVKCVSSHSVDLATGVMLAPGEWADADLEHPHNADLLANGHLVAPPAPADEPAVEPSSKAPRRKETS